MNRLRNLMHSKKMKYGGLATLLTILLIVIVVAVNVLCTTLADRYSWKLDLTTEKLYSLSDTTKDILKSLDQDVQIVMLFKEGEEDTLTKEILQRYANESSFIKLTETDPANTPGLANTFSAQGKTLQYGAIMVSANGRTKIVAQDDLYSSASTQTQQVSYLTAEQQFSSAILYVTSENTVAAAFTTGHNEQAADGALSVFEGYYQTLNADTQEINLITQDIPDNVNLLSIVAPSTDFTEAEIVKIDQFLSRGGSLQYFPYPAQKEYDMQRLHAFLNEWGIQVNNDFVVDNGTNNNAGNPMILFPNISQHEITKSLFGQTSRVYFPQSRSITISGEVSGVTVTPILTTSDDSFARSDLTSDSSEQIDSDTKGPVHVMVAAEKAYDNGNTGKIIIFGSAIPTAQSYFDEKGSGAPDLLSGAFQYLTGQDDQIVEIAGKSLNYKMLSITAQEALIVLVVLAVIPLLILVLGIVIWARRRHR